MSVSLQEIADDQHDLEARLAAWLKKVAAYDRSGDWGADGFLNTASALRAVCRIDQGVARGHVELARKLGDLPQVADAFGRGEISARHAVVVANASTPERAAAISDVEAELVDVARRHTPRDLGGVVRYLIDAIDGDGGAVSDEALFERRRLHLSSTLDSMLAINGICDPATAEILLAAVNAEIAQDHQDLDGRLSATTLERRTCDCDISRVITTGRSEILDVGRATRNPSPAIWKALVVRDQHCQAPGCDRPPDSCEAHHIVHWTRGGPTNLENLQLLCWHHHRYRHAHDAQARAA